MEKNREQELYLASLLLVTGFSFLLFALMMSLVDGNTKKIFWWIGGISFGSGILIGAFTLLPRAGRKNKNKLVP